MKLMLRYLKPYAGVMTLGLSIKTVGTAMELLLPYILNYILGTVVGTGSALQISLWGGAMIICATLGVIGNVTANRMAAKVARNASESIRHDLFSKTMYLSCRNSDKFTIPSLESRLTTDTYNVHHFIGMMQRMGVRAPILLIGGICITAWLDPMLTLIMVAVLPFITVSVYYISRKGIPLYTAVQGRVDKMVRVVREDTQGIRVIKALSKGDYERRRFDKENIALVGAEKKAGITMAATNPLMTLFMNLGLTAVILFGAIRVRGGSIEPSVIIAFMQYFTLITMAMMSVTRIFVMYSKGSASANRIDEVLAAEDELKVEAAPEFTPKANGKHIAFSNVSFSYNGTKNNLENITFAVSHGQSLGIIGATGSGKSTIIQLLMRYYDVTAGEIKIDRININAIPADILHSKFGVALQNDFLYADTVAENIRFGREMSFEQVRFAARLAQAEDFIEAFPDKYEHMLSAKGTNISGGQKQRILLARAMANSPEILILDDSSSALDYKTDANLRRAISENLNDTTTVIVAQRISSIMNCDLIIVLEDGEIVNMGTHKELLEHCEIYREISESQMGGAILE